MNVVLEKHTFFKRHQARDESVVNYVSVLRGLSNLCEFGNITESLIRDQLVRCTNNMRIQEKLLIKNPNLEEAIEIAKGVELTQQCMKEMNCSNRENVSVVHCDECREGVMKMHLSSHKEKKFGQEKIKLKCFRCGSFNHLANNMMCQARNVTCHKCRKKGHFARLCRESEVNMLMREDKVDLPHNKCILKVSSASKKAKTYPECELEVEVQKVKMFADSCSPYTLIN